MITVAEIKRLATEEGAEQPSAIAELARPGYRLVSTGGRAQIGASKLGGAPDLAADAEWPVFQWGDEPLPMLFLGQVTLKELAVEPQAVLTLPDDDLPVVKALGLDWDQAGADQSARDRVYERVMAYMRLCDRVAVAQYPRSGREPQHQFLGWPRSEQDSALISFAMTEAEEQDWYSRIPVEDELDRAIDERAMRWQLLLQIDHDDRLETDFGDGGGLYIGAPADDVARGELSRVDGTTQSG